MTEGWNWDAFIDPIIISLQITSVASIIVFVAALGVARWMSRSRLRIKVLLDTIFMLPLVLPPTVVGFILLYTFGKQGWFGKLLSNWFDVSLVFTWWGGVIAAVVVSFPLVYQTIKAGFDGVEGELEDAARSQGANEWQVLRYITLPLIRRLLAVAYMLGFARALGEFGATLMMAGNIPGRTQTVATAIYIAVDSGKLLLAYSWVAVMIIFSFVLMLLVRRRV
jgi:molybdate transport system permease protein